MRGLCACICMRAALALCMGLGVTDPGHLDDAITCFLYCLL